LTDEINAWVILKMTKRGKITAVEQRVINILAPHVKDVGNTQTD